MSAELAELAQLAIRRLEWKLAGQVGQIEEMLPEIVHQTIPEPYSTCLRIIADNPAELAYRRVDADPDTSPAMTPAIAARIAIEDYLTEQLLNYLED